MTKHTPGPWQIGDVAPDRTEFDACVRRDGWEVAYIKAFSPELAMANARLIAAAPELLAGLITAVSNLEWAATMLEVPEFSSFREDIESARNVIAKATGQ